MKKKVMTIAIAFFLFVKSYKDEKKATATMVTSFSLLI